MSEVAKIVQLTERIKGIRASCIGDGSALLKAYHWDPRHDLRLTSNTRLTRVITGLCVSFVYLSSVDQDRILEGIRLPPEMGVSIIEYQLVNELFLKMGFVSSLFSVVESVLRDYLRFLDEDACKSSNGVISICERLLTEKADWHRTAINCRVVDFLRLIRNSLHNNGVHRPLKKAERYVQVEYKGAKFELIDGKRLDFVSWDLLFDLADDVRELLFHLAHDRAISSIPGLIPDTHAL
jgi:hypothetical protein